MSRRLFCVLLWVLSTSCSVLFGPVARAADDVVVIVHPDNPNVVDRAFIARVYTGQLRGWPDGSPVFALDQPDDSPAHEQFCLTFLGKSAANVRAIWSQNIFTGKGLPPKQAGLDAEMKRLVAGNRNAVGYIRASQVDASVKVLTFP